MTTNKIDYQVNGLGVLSVFILIGMITFMYLN